MKNKKVQGRDFNPRPRSDYIQPARNTYKFAAEKSNQNQMIREGNSLRATLRPETEPELQLLSDEESSEEFGEEDQWISNSREKVDISKLDEDLKIKLLTISTGEEHLVQEKFINPNHQIVLAMRPTETIDAVQIGSQNFHQAVHHEVYLLQTFVSPNQRADIVARQRKEDQGIIVYDQIETMDHPLLVKQKFWSDKHLLLNQHAWPLLEEQANEVAKQRTSVNRAIDKYLRIARPAIMDLELVQGKTVRSTEETESQTGTQAGKNFKTKTCTPMHTLRAMTTAICEDKRLAAEIQTLFEPDIIGTRPTQHSDIRQLKEGYKSRAYKMSRQSEILQESSMQPLRT